MADHQGDMSLPQAPPTPDILPRIAHNPFHGQEPSADVTLVTPDQVHFSAHKAVLSLASPIFKAIFRRNAHADIVKVSEDARTLDAVLRFCYAAETPAFSNLADVKSVLDAALKYAIEALLRAAGESLPAFVHDDPLGVFVLGCRHAREDICRLAAMALLQHSLQSCACDELRKISAYQYHKLAQWHARCCNAAVGVTLTRDWFETCDTILRTDGCSDCWTHGGQASSQWYAPDLLWEYLGRARDALAMASCPSSAIVQLDDVLGSEERWRLSRCRSCSPFGKDYYKGGLEFSELLAQAIDRAVSEVGLSSDVWFLVDGSMHISLCSRFRCRVSVNELQGDGLL
ncbi:hypothetical protein DENSPDRAFT_844120 [Dentipellis sp. KUC8613]|nr:hypothetical protein DENSPDRAFT_844120 [Dentipellis sp. KUC8613]